MTRSRPAWLVRTHRWRGLHVLTHDADGQAMLWPVHVLGFWTVEIIPGGVMDSVDRVFFAVRRGLHHVR